MENKMTSPNIEKVCIAAMGPGETAQAIALATHLSQNGIRVAFALQFKETIAFVKTPTLVNASATHTPDGSSLVRWLAEEKPDAFIMCNSKMFKDDPEFRKTRPTSVPIFTIDSNRLFNLSEQPGFKFARWVDMYLINIPEIAFNLGLASGGGAYNIPTSVLEKLRVVGLIPSYEKVSPQERKTQRERYGVKNDERFIFSYGGSGITSLSESIGKLFPAVSQLVKEGRKLKVLFVGTLSSVDSVYASESWLIHRDNLDATDYYRALASSDLIYQHQGLGTMEQGIAAGVPIIANVVTPPADETEHTHEWEARPFMRAGACKMFFFNDPVEERVKAIVELLYNEESRAQMRAKQAMLYNRGEERALEIMTDYFKQRNA